MKRMTNPTLHFYIPSDKLASMGTIQKAKVTFCQGSENIFVKSYSSNNGGSSALKLTTEGFYTTLSVDEVNNFSAGMVKMELHVVDENGFNHISDIVTVKVEDVLSDGFGEGGTV